MLTFCQNNEKLRGRFSQSNAIVNRLTRKIKNDKCSRVGINKNFGIFTPVIMTC